MSVSMFITKPSSDAEKKLNVPFSTEAIFNEFILPASRAVGATMVSRFGIGMEVLAEDFSHLEGELQQVLRQVAGQGEVEAYLKTRFDNILSELKKVFENNIEAVAYIG